MCDVTTSSPQSAHLSALQYSPATVSPPSLHPLAMSSSVFPDAEAPLAKTAMSRSASETVTSPSFPSSSPHSVFSPQSGYSQPSSTPTSPCSCSSAPPPHTPASTTSTSSHSTSTYSPTTIQLFSSQRCPLCNFSTSFDPSLPHTCTRCGLNTPTVSTSPPTPYDCHPSSIIQEAATAYRFYLLSRMSPLLADLSKLVVEYLIWYRDPQSFHAGDRVDVMDVRGRWYGGMVRAVEGEEVRVGYEGWSKKWDQWIEVRSERLAPFGTKTKAVQTQRRDSQMEGRGGQVEEAPTA